MYFGRGLNKIQNPYTLKDMYDRYMEEVGDNPLYEVSYSEFVSICSDYYKDVIDSVFEGETYKMPYGLGELKISKKKIVINKLRPTNVDWKKSVECGKQVFHLNEHSSGFKYFFHWVKKKNIAVNKYIYRLVMTRENKRKLARLIKSGNYDYYEIF
jgi:hypothetical protein